MAKGVNVRYSITYQPIYDNAGNTKSYLYTINNNALLPIVFVDYTLKELIGVTANDDGTYDGLTSDEADDLEVALSKFHWELFYQLDQEGYDDGRQVLPKTGTFIPDGGLSENYNESEDDLVLPIKIKGRLIDSETGEPLIGYLTFHNRGVPYDSDSDNFEPSKPFKVINGSGNIIENIENDESPYSIPLIKSDENGKFFCTILIDNTELTSRYIDADNLISRYQLPTHRAQSKLQ